jgi:hypothetical protein
METHRGRRFRRRRGHTSQPPTRFVVDRIGDRHVTNHEEPNELGDYLVALLDTTATRRAIDFVTQLERTKPTAWCGRDPGVGHAPSTSRTCACSASATSRSPWRCSAPHTARRRGAV